jgi:hypothetical protein
MTHAGLPADPVRSGHLDRYRKENNPTGYNSECYPEIGYRKLQMAPPYSHSKDMNVIVR